MAPPVSGLLKPQESLQVVRMNELLADIKDKVFEVIVFESFDFLR